MDNLNPPFDLFISYSSRDAITDIVGHNVKLIEHLKRLLESHYHPERLATGRRRRFRVCTYEEDFELQDSVEAAIRERIANAPFLLVICSKASAESSYIHEELRVYSELWRGQSPLPAFWGLLPERAFPEVFAEGAIAANLAASPDLDFKTWLKQLENESHKIVAKVWDIPVDVVYDRFEEERKRKKRRLFLASGLVTLTFICFGALGYWQIMEKDTIISQREKHDSATLWLESNGYEVTDMDAEGEVSLTFQPSGGSQYEDPYLGHATKGLSLVVDLIRLHTVELYGVAVSDETISALSAIDSLKQLWLHNCDVSDASVEAIMQLKGLEYVILEHTKLTGGAVQRLKQAFPNCKFEVYK